MRIYTVLVATTAAATVGSVLSAVISEEEIWQTIPRRGCSDRNHMFRGTAITRNNRKRQLSSSVERTATSFESKQTAEELEDEDRLENPFLPLPDYSLPEYWKNLPPILDLDESLQSSSTGADFIDYIPPMRPRIVGGMSDSELDSFVMPLKWVNDRWDFSGCGGSLVSPCHVLTAAHCTTGNRAPQAVYVNAWRPYNQNTDRITGVTKPRHVSLIDWETTAIHPKFNDTTNVNDLAILSMAECVPEDKIDLFEIIEVADDVFWREKYLDLVVAGEDWQFEDWDVTPNNEISDDLATPNTRTAGFGRVQTNDLSIPPTLQSVDVSLINRDDCEVRYKSGLGDAASSFDLIQSDMYCAGGRDGGKDACIGDSGGPNYLTDPNTTQRTQLGVVSWGIGCAQDGFPGVYTSVAYHYDFIKNSVCNDERIKEKQDDGGNSTSTADTVPKPLLKLCLPGQDRTSGIGDDDTDPEPFIIGNALFREVMGIDSSDDEEDKPKKSTCSAKNDRCKEDDDCCKKLICNKKEKACKSESRDPKGRARPSQVDRFGGGATVQVKAYAEDGGLRRRNTRRSLLRKLV